jgi:hypothetical protein
MTVRETRDRPRSPMVGLSLEDMTWGELSVSNTALLIIAGLGSKSRPMTVCCGWRKTT